MRTELNDFIEYIKEKFNKDVKTKLDENPDTFEYIFNGNFDQKYEER